MNQNYFIGFDLLETFIDQASTVLPIYLMLIQQTKEETVLSHGCYSYRLEVAQIKNEKVYYWRRTVAIANFFAGEVLDGHKDRKATAQSALDVIVTYFEERGLTTVRASVSVPKDYLLLEGGCSRMGFDSEKKRFFLMPRETEKPTFPQGSLQRESGLSA